MASPSGTGREYPPELVHGEMCRTRFNIHADCDCGKSEPAAPSGTGHDTADCPVCGGPCTMERCQCDPPVAVPGPASVSPAEAPGFREDLDLLLDAFADVPEVVRVLKVTEEAGEAAQAYIGVTGLNPRKGVTHSNDELADELADVALTALVALGAFTADPIQRLTRRVAYVAARHRREVLDGR